MKNKIVLLLFICIASLTYGQPYCYFTSTNNSAHLYTFHATANFDSLIYHHQWSFGDGTSSSWASPSHQYTSAGTFVVCCTVFDSINNQVCNWCDSLIIGGGGSCFYTYSQTSANTVTFQAALRTGTYAQWNFGGFFGGTGTVITHTFLVPGTYQVCMDEIDSASGTTLCSYCDVITVGGGSVCTYTATHSPNTFNTYDFNTTAGTGASIQWNFGDGSAGYGTPISHTYPAQGVYQVCMDLVDTSTGTILCTFCDSVLINNGGLNNCSFISLPDSINNLLVYFFNTGVNAVTFAWDFGDGSAPSTLSSPTHQYAAAGTYNVCLVTTDINGLSCTYCVPVSAGNPSGNCIFTFMPDSMNQNLVYFAGSSIPGATDVVWDFGDGGTGIGINTSHTFLPGLYTVCMTLIDSATRVVICTTCNTITINGGFLPCSAYFVYTNLGLTGYFIDLSNTNPAGASYTWDFGDGASSSQRFAQHTYALPGTYTACLTVAANGCIDQYCAPVVADTAINSNPVCQAFYVIVQLAPFQFSVVNLSSGVNLSFNWDFGDGSNSTLPYPSHYYSTTGSYNLCLTVDDGRGCTDTYCDTLNVDSLGNIFRTTSGFNINVISPSQLTGVAELSAGTSFSVFPNPVNAALHVDVQADLSKPVTFRIYSLEGAEISNGVFTKRENILNLEKLNSGAYLIELRNAAGFRSYQKIIKD